MPGGKEGESGQRGGSILRTTVPTDEEDRGEFSAAFYKVGYLDRLLPQVGLVLVEGRTFGVAFEHLDRSWVQGRYAPSW